MSVRAEQARAALARLGLDPDTLAAEGAGAAERLAPLLAGDGGTSLADALAEFPSAPIAALLVALEPHAGRAPRKAIRRALYRLRQRGVAVPEPAPAPPAPRPTGAGPEGLVTAFGGDGDRILWLVKPLREGGSLVVYAHQHDRHGLLELTAAELGRKRVREVRQNLEASGLRLVPADWRVVDALLVEAQERTTGEEPRKSYLKVRPRITTEPPRPAAEPVSKRVAPPTDHEIPALVAGSAALLAEPELATWMPLLEDLKPFVDELDTAHESPLVLSRGAQEERVRAVIRRAVLTLVPPDVLARRLEGTAYVLAETGRQAPARQALAVAAALRARPADAADVPLALAFVERPLGELLAAATTRREQEQKGSLVVTPGQFLRDRSSAHPSRTRG